MLKDHGVENLIGLLNNLSPEQISYQVQLAVQGKFALTAVETVIFNDEGQVLLLDRPNSENEIPEWRGRPHSPGSMLRETDSGFQDAFNRVQNSEINSKFAEKPVQVKTIITQTDRGTETAVVFLCRLAEEPKTGYWCGVNQLPDNLLSHHFEIIEAAYEHWESQNSTTKSYL